MKLKGKIAIVTGGGRGIGKAIALAFAREGADVVVTARTESEIEKVAEDIKALGSKGVPMVADLGKKESLQTFVDRISTQFSSMDILVNNAGVGSGQNPRVVAEYDDDFWEQTLALNLTAPYLLTKAFLPKMIAQKWGRIINISSVAGKIGFPFGAAYSTSKHGLIGLTRTVALEVATQGVTVNAICPGPIRTSMLEKRIRFNSENEGIPIEEVEKSFNSIQRLLEPQEVAAIAVYLASDEAKSMTGQSINIDGGMVMH
jgi:meso-butanediol dehydrogenase/(S,S)-butanediol dehydrogenase/diacetyl reductase